MGKGWDHRPHANGNSRAGILFSRTVPCARYHLWDAWMDGTDIVSKHNRSAVMMEDNTAGFSLVLRRRLMTVDRISGFLQGASMPLRLPGLPDHDGPGGSALRGAGP